MNLLTNDNVILGREKQKNIITTHTSVTTCATCETCDVFFLKNISLVGKSTTHNLLSFIKLVFINFFKMLNLRISCSMSLLLPSYVMKRKNPVSISLFMLKGVKSVVSLTRNKLKMFLFLTRCFVVALPILFICVPSRCRSTFSCMYVQIRSVCGHASELWRMFYANRFYATMLQCCYS